MKKNKYLLSIICTILLLLTVSTKVKAADGVDFAIRPILPSTQIDYDKGYYYFQTEPGVKQTLDLSISNNGDEPKIIEVIMQNGITQSNGILGYSEDIKDIHESLKNPISEIVVPNQKEYTVNSNEEVIAHLEVNTPKDSYDGIKVGKVLVREKRKETKGISQEFVYGLGVVMSESGIKHDDGKTLELEKVQANINLGNRVTEAYIVNPEPKTIENLEVRSYVTKKGDDKKIKERNIDNFVFAPNSKVVYTVPWGLTNFEAGEYTFHFEAKNSYETFNLVDDFVIRGEDAKKLNEAAAFAVNTPPLFKILVLSLNGILILIIIIILFRNKKWVEQLKSKKNKKNRKNRKKRK